MLFGDLAFFVLGVAGKRDDLHPVQKRTRHVVRVRRGQEHHVREVVFNLHIVIDESRVLFRIQHLKHGRRRVAPEILTHLVDLIEQDKRVRRLGLFQRLNDLAGHRPDVRPTVTPDLGFITHAAQ